jgi:hypothetical protein
MQVEELSTKYTYKYIQLHSIYYSIIKIHYKQSIFIFEYMCSLNALW